MGKSQIEQNWEYHFNEEALRVEEMLANGAILEFDKSRVRIALEQKILDWRAYKNWFHQTKLGSVMNYPPTETQIRKLNEIYRQDKPPVEGERIWNSELIPLHYWDGKLIVLGCAFDDRLNQISNVIFVLCHPKVIDMIVDAGFSEAVLQKSWAEIEENQIALSEKARKNSDGFVILKIVENRTVVFSMDDDLKKEVMDWSSLEISLDGGNFLSDAAHNEDAISLSLEKLGIKVLDYNYLMLTPLRRGMNTVGFFIGFKISAVLEDDLQSLAQLSKQAAS